MRWSDEYNKKEMLIEGSWEEGALALVDVCAGARRKAAGCQWVDTCLFWFDSAKTSKGMQMRIDPAESGASETMGRTKRTVECIARMIAYLVEVALCRE